MKNFDLPGVPDKPNRRKFMADSSRFAAAGAVLASGGSAWSAGFHHGNNDTLKVGLVGCGGRGTGAVVNAVNADSNIQLVGMADAFRDRIDSSARELQTQIPDQMKVAEEGKFTGFDCCEKMLEQVDLDVVLLAAPPHFRPAQLAACVAANKHAFVEKPIAVDVPGVKSVLASCQLAREKGLSIVSGLCWRYDWKVQEMIKRIQDGAIGEIRAIQENYLTGLLWHRGDKPEWSRMEYQLRNWLYFNWLSGDHLAEQHIHSVDKALWLMGDRLPKSVYGSGGRLVRTDPMFGNIYDHFSCVFEWEDSDIKVFTHCRQMPCPFNDTEDYVIGTNGNAEILRGVIRNGDGVERVRAPQNTPGMYDAEHIEFFKSIRTGPPINNGEYMCYSTLMCLMGRDACYTGARIVTEEYWKDETRLGPESYEWNDYEPEPVQKPGTPRG